MQLIIIIRKKCKFPFSALVAILYLSMYYVEEHFVVAHDYKLYASVCLRPSEFLMYTC